MLALSRRIGESFYFIIPEGRFTQSSALLLNPFIEHALHPYPYQRVQGLRDAALLALLYGCGLRRSEIVGIDIEHLNEKEGAIRIWGKGNKERIVYPPQRAWEMVSEWIKDGRGDDADPLFCRIRKGDDVTVERLTDQTVYYIMMRLILLTGIENFSPHDLRGSFISYLLDNGEDIKTVADIVGHADVRTTAGYDRRGEQRKKVANRKIDF